MKTFLKWAALAPVLIVILVFAVVNREPVRIVFDPFDSADSSLSITTPLFLALFAVAILGALVGGFVTWLGQAKHRRSSRFAQADAAKLRADNERLRAATGALPDRGRVTVA